MGLKRGKNRMENFNFLTNVQYVIVCFDDPTKRNVSFTLDNYYF